MEYILHGSKFEIEPVLLNYATGGTALTFICKCDEEEGMYEPFMTASVNFAECPLPPDQIWVKDWSENEGVLEWMLQEGILVGSAVASHASGFVVAVAYQLAESYAQTARENYAKLEK